MEIRLRVKRSIVTAKRSVLEANCGYFETMFDGRFEPSQEVDLSCVAEDISIVKKILKYFDGKSLKCICRTLTSTLKLLKVAYFLQAHSLIKQCLAYMKRFICLDNAMGLYFDLKEMELNVPTITDILKSRFHDHYIRQEATNKLTSTQVKHAINDGLFQFCSAGSLLGFIHHYLVTDLTTDRVKVCHELLTCFNFEKSLKHAILSAELILDIENNCSNIEALVLPSDLVKGDVDDFISVLKKLLVDLKEKDDKWMNDYLRAVVCVVPDIRGECDSIEEAHIYLYIPSSGVWYKFDKPLSNEIPEKEVCIYDDDCDEDDEEEDQLEEPALEEFLGNSGKFWLSKCKVSRNSLIASMDSDIAFFRISLPDMCVTKVVKNPYKDHDVCKGMMISPVVIHFDDILLVTKLYHESDDVDEEREVSLSEGGIFVDELEEYNRNSVNKLPQVLTDGPGAFMVTECLWCDGNAFIVIEVDYRQNCCIHFIYDIIDMLRFGLPEKVTSYDKINLEFGGVPTVLCPEKRIKSGRYAILEVGEKTWVTATMEYQSFKIKNTEYKYEQIESIKTITDVDLRPRSMNIKKLATYRLDSLWVFEGGNTETGISSLKQHKVTGAMEAEEINHTPPPFHFCSAMFVNEWRMSSFHKFLKLATFGIH